MKLLKKLGYGYAIHYNTYRKKYEVYKLSEWCPGTEITKNTRVSLGKTAKKAIKSYIKTYKKSTLL